CDEVSVQLLGVGGSLPLDARPDESRLAAASIRSASCSTWLRARPSRERLRSRLAACGSSGEQTDRGFGEWLGCEGALSAAAAGGPRYNTESGSPRRWKRLVGNMAHPTPKRRVIAS